MHGPSDGGVGAVILEVPGRFLSKLQNPKNSQVEKVVDYIVRAESSGVVNLKVTREQFYDGLYNRVFRDDELTHEARIKPLAGSYNTRAVSNFVEMRVRNLSGDILSYVERNASVEIGSAFFLGLKSAVGRAFGESLSR